MNPTLNYKMMLFHHFLRHCHAIWQLYEKLEGVFTSTNDLVLLLKTI